MPAAVISSYDPAWPARAERLLTEVRTALASLPGSERFVHEHIGSTAVPGLGAKPIVDLQVRMPVLPPLAELAEALAPTPFVPAHGSRPDSPGVHRDAGRPGDQAEPDAYEKRLFHIPAGSAILHVRRTDSPFARFVVDFRDWLRAHPEETRRYEQVKRRLADEHAGASDYDDYTRAKTAFFDEVQPRLREWSVRRAAGS
ncbi:GrpB family protein [Lentzea jiangxiensis]|uniref:Dephospho-CoA kinase n=1 Tax=Lentzea jiangxiensis TaxID=641025 RepID=A0A1H0WDT2_9PSEU|nr:GrpB family protein [Lentzea jiangxiensis]SDP88456.1 dephospho-CoA kinase [Lentzea jiangxiensis]